jgi:hypothetical protein
LVILFHIKSESTFCLKSNVNENTCEWMTLLQCTWVWHKERHKQVFQLKKYEEKITARNPTTNLRWIKVWAVLNKLKWTHKKYDVFVAESQYRFGE